MDFLGGSLKIGRLFGITIRLHMLFVIWVGYNVLIAGDDWTDTLRFYLLLFGVVLCHEFGHCFGARIVGGHADNILLWPLGGLAYAEAPPRPWPQFVTLAAGPLVNFIFALLSGAVFLLLVYYENWFGTPAPAYLETAWDRWLSTFFILNVVLFCFNLLPIFPLDGGQLLRTILWPFMGVHRATILATQVGIVGSCVLGGLGVMWSQWMLVAIAIFGGLTSLQHYRAARAGLFAERFLGASQVLRNKPQRRGFWSRVFGGRARPAVKRQSAEAPATGQYDPVAPDSPATAAAELNRLMQKVTEDGPGSLSYVERQRLERLLREREQNRPES